MFEFETTQGDKILLPLFGCAYVESKIGGCVYAHVNGLAFALKTTMQEIKYAMMQAQGAQAPQGKIQL